MNAWTSRWVLSLLPVVVSFAAPLRAQGCAQMPNECCPPESADSLFSVTSSASAYSLYSFFLSQTTLNSSAITVAGPSSSLMTMNGMTGQTFASSCQANPPTPVFDSGTGIPTVETYGTTLYRMPMPVLTTGMIGLADLYHSVLVIDTSLPSWTGTGTHLKALTGDELPVPDVGSNHLLGEGYGLQPRPGSMPGQYIYQAGNDFYQYGGPVDTGANPQTTAVYNNPSDDPPSGTVVLTNNLSGAQLWWFSAASPAYVEIRHVDGTVARFDSFTTYISTWTPPSGTKLWRLTSVRDAYDNLASYSYDSINRLTAIQFPSGLKQHFSWSGGGTGTPPSWSGWSSSFDLLEVSYTYNTTSPTEVAGRTWGIVFENNTTGSFVQRHFGGRLYRTYSATRSVLVDLSSPGPYAIGSGSEVTGQVVHDFAYNPTSRTLTLSQKVHTGTAFHGTLSVPSDLASAAILSASYNTGGRLVELMRSMTLEGLTFSYPTSGFRTTDLLSGTSMAGIEVTSAEGTIRRYEYDYRSGRIYTVKTTPSNDLAGRPRATHSTTVNSTIGGVRNVAFEPEWMEVYNIFDTGCVCQKPIERQLRSRRSGTTYVRTWNFEYDSSTKLVTSRKEPNPEAGTGTFAAQVEWTYTYTQLVGSGSWGAWVPATEVTPDGTYTYSYTNLSNRAVSGHGQMAGTIARTIDDVRIQDSLTGAATTSTDPVVETTYRNLASPTTGLPGQPWKVVDGDGVETRYEYSASGYMTASIDEAGSGGGDVKMIFTPNSMGEVTSVTANALSSTLSPTTTITRMAGAGVPTTVSSTSAGVTREARAYYDRFGHLTVVRQNNLSSSGSKPNKHGVSGATARDWVERQNHYHYNRLMETYVDRKPLDEAVGTGQFLVTQYDYGTDGRLSQVTNPNGSVTAYTFDGFGTLYTTVTNNPGNTQSVRGPKTFINPFLELVGSYEYTDSDHLWTTLTRNDAGAITQIVEPSTTAPTDYTPHASIDYSTGGAIHNYEIDKLGRVTKAESLSGSTVLQRRTLRHDKLSRQIWQRDEVMGFGSGDHYVAWRYENGKASQLKSEHRSGATNPTSFAFNALGLVKMVTDGFGNTVEYSFYDSTPFVETVTRTDLQPVGSPRVTTTDYAVNRFGQIIDVKDGSPQLFYTYAYNSLGRVDSYKDPSTPTRREQKFLADGLGRIVEHVRVGDSGGAVTNSTTFLDAGQSDGHTKVSRFDDWAQPTITHRDFAGRVYIVQNPGGDTPPSSSTKNKAMCLYAEYDGASRLKAVYDGSNGKTEFFRDGPGRLIQRRLVNQSSGGVNSADTISQFNTNDWFRRDAIGRIKLHHYWGAPDHSVVMGHEQFDQDSLGRVHAARFVSAFASSHTLEVESTFSGGNPFRMGLDYEDNLSHEVAQMDYGRDAIGRLTEVQWDRAPGSIGSMEVLAVYGWAGSLRRERTVTYDNAGVIYGKSAFTYDDYGRLTKIKDDVTTNSGGTFGTKSEFDYSYDEASNLTKEKYTKVNGRFGDRFAYDAYHRLSQAWQGVDSTTMSASGNPTSYSSSAIHEHLTYNLDDVNNRTTTTSQTGSSPLTTTYARQDSGHAQGESNRYHTILLPGASAATVLEYDNRGNMTYDGRFVYRYDYLNRLQEVWRVEPNDTGDDTDRFAIIEEGALEEAQQEVKLEVPDLYSRLAREHTDPTFRNRLKATISGGVLRITPTPQGGGGRPGWLPVDGTLVLAAVYVYDGFNRRTLSILVDPSVGETQVHTWDGWRQATQHRVEWSGTAWVAKPTKQFVWGSRLDELVAYRRLNGSTWENYFLLHGGQDTAAKLVNASGTVVEQYEYDPYGKATCYKQVSGTWTPFPTSQFGLPFLWKGIRLDEITGLLQMRNRYYSVEVGRFLSRDPMGEWYDERHPGNGYTYAADNPLVVADAFGLQSDPTQPSTSDIVTDGLVDVAVEAGKSLGDAFASAWRDAPPGSGLSGAYHRFCAANYSMLDELKERARQRSLDDPSEPAPKPRADPYSISCEWPLQSLQYDIGATIWSGSLGGDERLSLSAGFRFGGPFDPAERPVEHGGQGRASGDGMLVVSIGVMF